MTGVQFELSFWVVFFLFYGQWKYHSGFTVCLELLRAQRAHTAFGVPALIRQTVCYNTTMYKYQKAEHI